MELKIFDDFFNSADFARMNLPSLSHYKKLKFARLINEEKRVKDKNKNRDVTLRRFVQKRAIQQKTHKISKNFDAIINNINNLIKYRGDLNERRR